MALQATNFVTDYGITLATAYVKIIHIHGNKTRIHYSVQTYADKISSDNNLGFFKVENFSFEIDLQSEDNFLVQCYKNLKTKEIYSQMEDV